MTDFGKAVALVVGVSKFRNRDNNKHFPELGPLPGACRDAQRMRDALLLIGFPKENVICLTDSNAGSSKIEFAMHRLSQRRSLNGLVVLYFACHGFVKEVGNTKTLFLLPWDARVSRERQGGVEFLKCEQGINTRELSRFLEQLSHSTGPSEKRVRTGGRVLYVDACYSGGIPVRTALGIRGLAVITACPAKGSALEYTSRPRGLFTTRLIEAICGLGYADESGFVTVSHVMAYLDDTVRRDSALAGFPQEPFARIAAGRLVVGRSVHGDLRRHVRTSKLNPDVIRRAIEALDSQAGTTV